MNFFKTVISSVYQYYSTGATKDEPYEKTIFVLLAIILLNIFSICVLMIPYDSLRAFIEGYSKLSRISFFVIIIIIYCIIMRLIIPEKKVKDFQGSKKYVVAFSAQYPKGNKAFIENVKKNLNADALKELSKGLKTKIILKVNSEGNVVDVSTYGENEVFNIEVKKAAEKATYDVKWEAGKNNRGEKVIDIVNLPFKYSNT